MIRVEVDFAEMDGDGFFRWLPQNVDRPELLRPGLPVELYDSEGNTAQGTYEGDAERGLILIEVTAGTFRGPGVTA